MLCRNKPERLNASGENICQRFPAGNYVDRVLTNENITKLVTGNCIFRQCKLCTQGSSTEIASFRPSVCEAPKNKPANLAVENMLYSFVQLMHAHSGEVLGDLFFESLRTLS